MDLSNKISGLSLKPQGWGVFRISSYKDDKRIVFGLKFSMAGFFWVGEFWQVFRESLI